jgi:hypothetical protein
MAVMTVQSGTAHRGLAIASLVLGILSAFFGLFAGVTWVLVLPGAVLTLVFGIVGRKHGMGKAGIALGAVALALGIWGVVIFGQAASELHRNLNEIGQMSDYNECVMNAPTLDDINNC